MADTQTKHQIELECPRCDAKARVFQVFATTDETLYMEFTCKACDAVVEYKLTVQQLMERCKESDAEQLPASDNQVAQPPGVH